MSWDRCRLVSGKWCGSSVGGHWSRHCYGGMVGRQWGGLICWWRWGSRLVGWWGWGSRLVGWWWWSRHIGWLGRGCRPISYWRRRWLGDYNCWCGVQWQGSGFRHQGAWSCISV